jgi:hypothetical protein
MCEQLGMLTQSGLAHSTKPAKTTTKCSGSTSKHNASADAEGELFWPRLRVLTEKAHWAMTILAGLRRFGLLDDESATGPAAGARQDAGPLHIHVIGAQDNKDEGATTAATFR